MARETGKQRSQRIQIDYYRHRGGLHYLKFACVIIGLVGAGAYAAYVLVAGGASHTSTGPLAMAHASFESDCEQCHQNFTPIDSRGSRLDWALVGLDSRESIGHIEAACQECHRVGDHHRATMNADWQLEDQDCAGCHIDHQGRNHDLTSVAAKTCVACHGDLNTGCSGSPNVRASVTRFDGPQHGDFASLQQGDPGTVKFDHHQHMLPGQVSGGDKGAFTIEMLDPSQRARYGKPGQDASSPVMLDCSSCHEMAGNPDSTNSLIADGELGRYMKPISFDKHCAACHAIHPEPATADSTPLPHAVPWSKIDLLLAATISGARATNQARTPRDDSQTTPQPGQGLGTAAANDADVSAVDVNLARSMIESKCLQCHDAAAITDEAIASSLEGTGQPMIPARWLKHGLYDHAAHRRIDCRYCHAAAYGNEGSTQPPRDQESVMISGIDSCTGCHRDADAPTPTSITLAGSMLGGQPTWASDNCMLCHRYHTPLSAAKSPAVSVAKTEVAP